MYPPAAAMAATASRRAITAVGPSIPTSKTSGPLVCVRLDPTTVHTDGVPTFDVRDRTESDALRAPPAPGRSAPSDRACHRATIRVGGDGTCFERLGYRSLGCG